MMRTRMMTMMMTYIVVVTDPCFAQQTQARLDHRVQKVRCDQKTLVACPAPTGDAVPGGDRRGPLGRSPPTPRHAEPGRRLLDRRRRHQGLGADLERPREGREHRTHERKPPGHGRHKGRRPLLRLRGEEHAQNSCAVLQRPSTRRRHELERPRGPSGRLCYRGADG